MNIKNNILISVKLILVSIVIFSLIYTILLGGLGQIWSNKAKGSLVEYEGEVVGSSLIGQSFNSPQYFSTRPSSIGYDASTSGSANLAPNNPVLKERVKQSLIELNNKYGIENDKIPADIISESGSGLDPHITPEAAYLQVSSISDNTGIKKEKLDELIDEHTEGKLLGLFGQKRVNVLELNISLKEVIDK